VQRQRVDDAADILDDEIVQQLDAARPHRRASCGQFRRAAAPGRLPRGPRAAVPAPPVKPGAGSGESQIGDIGRGSGRRSYRQQPWLSYLDHVIAVTLRWAGRRSCALPLTLTDDHARWAVRSSRGFRSRPAALAPAASASAGERACSSVMSVLKRTSNKQIDRR
jgi:hypothetical protein